jgi:hypothetical protein
MAKIVLAQIRDFADPDSGGAFTIKEIRKVLKQSQGNGEQTNALVHLKPESTLISYQLIEVSPEDERIRVIAEYLRVIKSKLITRYDQAHGQTG